MDTVLLVLQIVTLLGIGCIILFRKFLFSYSSEKGKNLATKEDIEDITRRVESTKNEYISDIERLKVELALLSRKHDILLGEKVRVFKKLQERLVGFKRYCEAALGSYDSRGEFHQNLESLDKSIDKSALLHITALHEIEQEDFIFLSERSKEILSDLHTNCSMMCSMELAVCANRDDKCMVESTIPVYEAAMVNIDKCLQSLYEELEFPSKEKER
ncbi:hypothetical protein CGK45_22735 [Vibrio parahaemolyticus]|uniref:hypothetical protein n=1 Tax=Vibrio parahaemolyticus TaxID=670 RepID=UPI00111EB6D3|nr:hypothetical protein [Vibrio parahaemolyticus]TNZ55704.1 hypothetical protein CGK45_22735 [Vibrio parahaemolyticus]